MAIATQEITIQEAVSAWLEDIRRRGSRSTLTNYSRVAWRWQGFHGPSRGQTIGEITPHDLREFIYCLQNDGVQPSTIRSYLLTLSTLFNFCVQEEWLVDNPLAGHKVRRPRVPIRVVEVYSDEDIARLLAVDAVHGSHYQAPQELHKAVIYFLLDTGVRAAELCGLKMQDVTFDEEGGTAKVFGKGSKERMVVFSEPTADAIRAYLAATGNPQEGALFIGQSGRPLTPGALYEHLKKLSRKAGLNKCGLHRFRHSYAVRFLVNGGSLNLLQRQLGHVQPSMTLRYATLAGLNPLAAATYRRFSPLTTLVG